jgi:hypothetical protein
MLAYVLISTPTLSAAGTRRIVTVHVRPLPDCAQPDVVVERGNGPKFCRTTVTTTVRVLGASNCGLEAQSMGAPVGAIGGSVIFSVPRPRAIFAALIAAFVLGDCGTALAPLHPPQAIARSKSTPRTEMPIGVS